MYFACMESGLVQIDIDAGSRCSSPLPVQCVWAWLALIVQVSYVNWLNSILKLGGVYFNKQSIIK